MKKDYKRIRAIICLVLVVCYAIGMLCMFIDAFSIGVALWAVSLVGGFAVLYSIKNAERKAAEAERMRKEAEGEDDAACE